MPTLTFQKKGHKYMLEGRPLTGVTSVLQCIAKPALIQWSADEALKYVREHVSYAIPGKDGGYWAVKPSTLEEARLAHRRKKESAGSKGTDVHEELERIIKYAMDNTMGFIEETYNDNPQVMKFINWAKMNTVKFLASEKIVHSPSLWLAGTLDFVCEINGKKYVGDIKTSSGIYGREYFAQTAAYRMMLEEAGEKDFYGSVVVRLGKDGSFEEVYSYDYENDKKLFLACLEVYRTIGLFDLKTLVKQ